MSLSVPTTLPDMLLRVITVYMHIYMGVIYYMGLLEARIIKLQN